MKFLIYGFAILASFTCFGYFPSIKNQSEMRLIATSKEGLTNMNSENWDIEGVISGNHQLADKLSVSPVFKLSTTESSNLGALMSYEINKFITLAVAGNINDKKSFGGVLLVHGLFDVHSVKLLPFLKIDHKAVAEAGLATGFYIDRVLFSVGLSYLPPLGDDNYHNIRLMVGTGLKNIIK